MQASNPAGVRLEIDQAIASGDAHRSRALLSELWRLNLGPALARYIVSRYEKVSDALGFPEYRVAILRSFTVEPIVPLLRATAFAYGVNLKIYVGDFNNSVQEVLNADSGLYKSKPQAVIVALEAREVAPELWQNAAALSGPELEAAAARALDQVGALMTALRSHCNAEIILHTLEVPTLPSKGILDAQDSGGQVEAIRCVNRGLSDLARDVRGAYLLDYDGLVARHGRDAWHDERKWVTVRLPISAAHLSHLANEWTRYLLPLTGRISKALVLDLDNTLWGGVVGEDGFAGIQLGPDYPGAFYQDLQRAILDLYERGIILAVASKNNHEDAMEVIEKHPGMVLSQTHFAALRINWTDKAQSLREIAAELNIGVDALAFLDDSPVEREWVRSQLPEVAVIDLPSDPAEFARILRDCPLFERLSLTEEDRERGRYYASDRLRTELASNTWSVEDFYRSLAMEVEIAYAAPEDLARVAQLTQKTNQLNVTTRRYTEQQIESLVSDARWKVYSVRVRDRFGDNGLVAVVIVHFDGTRCEIDTFLMSCRVMGRTVETSVLATVAEDARASGADRLVGWYLPTAKNEVVRDLYSSHGFICTEDGASGSCWECSLTSTVIVSPPYIERRLLFPTPAA